MIDAYFPALEEIGDTIDDLDEEMEEGATQSIVRKIHGVRHDVRLLRHEVWPLREVSTPY